MSHFKLEKQWAIGRGDASDILPSDFTKEVDGDQMWMVFFPFGHAMSPGTTDFRTAFSDTTSTSAFSSALFQLIFETLERYRVMYRAIPTERKNGAVDPITVHLETVVSHEMDGDEQSYDETSIMSNPATNPFMTNVPNNQNIAGLRLIVIFELSWTILDPGEIMKSIIDESELERDVYFDPSKSKKKTAPRPTMSFLGAERASSFASSLLPTTRYKLISTMEIFRHVCDELLCQRKLALPRTGEEPMLFQMSPDHPTQVFSVLEHWKTPPVSNLRTRQGRPMAYLVEGYLIYPYPERVVVVNREYQKLYRLYNMLLPHYQARHFGGFIDDLLPRPHREGDRPGVQADPGEHDLDFMDADDDRRESPDATYLARMDFANDANVQPLMDDRALASRSSFYLVRYMGKLMMDTFVKKMYEGNPTEADRKRRRNIQLYLLGLMRDMLMSPLSDVSAPWRAINQRLEERQKTVGTLGHTLPLVYNNLSTWGNLMVGWLAKIDDVLVTCSSHIPMWTVLNGMFDAYRESLSLHFNVLLVGEAGVSKSRIVDVMSKMSVPGTYTNSMRSTANAHFGDTDDLDRMTGAEEDLISRDAAKDDKSNAGGNIETLKERLTNGLAQKTVFDPNPNNGMRQNRTTYARLIGSLLMAMNTDPSKVDKPLLTRFARLHLIAEGRPGKSVAEVDGVEKNLDYWKRLDLQNMYDQYRDLQTFVLYFHKAIGIHAVADVTLSVFNAFRGPFIRAMREKHLIKVEGRDLDRVSMFLRNCIAHHIYYILYCHPCSPHYLKPFSPLHFIVAEPLMHDTVEMVIWAFSMCAAQFVDTVQQRVLDGIRSYIMEPGLLRALDEVSGLIDANAFTDLFLNPATRVTTDTSDKVWSASASSHDPAGPAKTAQETFPQLLYSYFLVRGGVHDIARDLCTSFMTDDTTSLSEKVIKTVIYRLLRTTFRGHLYQLRDGPPERTSHMANMPSAIDLGDYIAIHLDLLESGRDPVHSALRECVGMYTEDLERVEYVIAARLHPTMPHRPRKMFFEPAQSYEEVLATTPLESQPKAVKRKGGIDVLASQHDRAVTLDSALFLGATLQTDSRNVSDPVERVVSAHIPLKMSLDQHSRRMRAEQLCLDPAEADKNTGSTSFKKWERLAREKNEDGKQYGVAKCNGYYPDSVLTPEEAELIAQTAPSQLQAQGGDFMDGDEAPNEIRQLFFKMYGL